MAAIPVPVRIILLTLLWMVYLRYGSGKGVDPDVTFVAGGLLILATGWVALMLLRDLLDPPEQAEPTTPEFPLPVATRLLVLVGIFLVFASVGLAPVGFVVALVLALAVFLWWAGLADDLRTAAAEAEKEAAARAEAAERSAQGPQGALAMSLPSPPARVEILPPEPRPQSAQTFCMPLPVVTYDHSGEPNFYRIELQFRYRRDAFRAQKEAYQAELAVLKAEAKLRAALEDCQEAVRDELEKRRSNRGMTGERAERKRAKLEYDAAWFAAAAAQLNAEAARRNAAALAYLAPPPNQPKTQGNGFSPELREKLQLTERMGRDEAAVEEAKQAILRGRTVEELSRKERQRYHALESALDETQAAQRRAAGASFLQPVKRHG